jgi:tRNA (guanine-N7-)-methyltransferase
MQRPSRSIISNQLAPYEHLHKVVLKHVQSTWQRPISSYSLQAIRQTESWLSNRQGLVLLDTGCGVGLSSYRLAMQNPNCLVIGVDKSAARLQKGLSSYASSFSAPASEMDVASRVLLLRADLADYWRLLHKSGIPIQKQYILYPNPWPKAEHFMRRWHGHPVFPVIGEVCLNVELRTNWDIYAKEFEMAWHYCNSLGGCTMPQEACRSFTISPQNQNNGTLEGQNSCTTNVFNSTNVYLTPFEQKYANSGQVLYGLECTTG